MHAVVTAQAEPFGQFTGAPDHCFGRKDFKRLVPILLERRLD